MELNNVASMSRRELMACISDRKSEIERKLKNGDTQSSFAAGLESVKRNLIYEKLNGTYKQQYPYEYLAEDGVINYKGTIFVCDAEKNAICLGDMSDRKKVLVIPLEGGGNLMVNRDNLGDLSNAITMFTPADQNRIMRAIADDKKAQDALRKIEEDKNSIGDDADRKVLDTK